MKRLVSVGLALSFVAAAGLFNMSNGQDGQQATSSIEKKDGLETVEFDTLTGTVEVNLPDDLSATDTISGTVLLEPKGETKEEKAQNEDTLRGYVVEIAETQEVQEEPPKEPPAKPRPPVVKTPQTPDKPRVCPPLICSNPPSIPIIPGKLGPCVFHIPNGGRHIDIILRGNSGQTICSSQVPCNPTPPRCPPLVIPNKGTCGGSVRIPGKCDGRSSTSNVTINGNRCPVLAESPRQQICRTPNNLNGPCTIVRNEQGCVTRGVITMVPKPPTCTGRPPAQSIPVNPSKFVFHRTGPFVSQEIPSCYRDQSPTANITKTSITWEGPQSIQGDPRVASTLVFQEPPEVIRVGEKFSLTASVSGDERVSTQAMYNGDHSWIKPLNRPRSVTLAKGYGEPSQTFEFEVADYLKMIDEALKAHPEYASQVTPEVRNKLPAISIFCPGRINVKVEWKYVPIK
ncbi:MAG: hypothetical protein K2Y22_10005 [Candidatus Obscuribacterales bacterium]|nr:hypothetical protein [Candidatus Obscuribacterales bacterium]